MGKDRLKNPVLSVPLFAGSGKNPSGLKLDPCVECGKPIEDGYYGRWGDGGVCSKTCDILHMRKKEGE